jgi:hypothetical protein
LTNTETFCPGKDPRQPKVIGRFEHQRPRFGHAAASRRQVADIDPDRPTVPQLLKPGPKNPPGAGFQYQDGGQQLLSAVIAEVTHQPRWAMPDGCCLSRLMSRRGPPWYLRSATESDDLVIHELCLESQNVVGIPVAPNSAQRG